MQIIISSRHGEVTQEMKEYGQARLEAVLNHGNLKISSARLVLDIVKDRHFAEIIVNMKNHTVEADTETEDMFLSIDKAVHRVERQMRKILDKVQNHHHENLATATSDEEELTPEEEMYLELAAEYAYKEV
ncbi:ribosome-associated translation inhibitor RaiA [Lentisphaerota bacterium WC36G]|nr:ribosome-associated translation inhibitor RaiA [Lentisphaerae bacterium WC36]